MDIAMTSTLAITLKPLVGGWAVCLTDGRELARFRGPGARERALRYVSTKITSRPRAQAR
jgi:hypothetical protein